MHLCEQMGRCPRGCLLTEACMYVRNNQDHKMVVDWFIKKYCTPLEQFHGYLHHHRHPLCCHSDHLLHHRHHHHSFVCSALLGQLVSQVVLCPLVLVAGHNLQGHPTDTSVKEDNAWIHRINIMFMSRTDGQVCKVFIRVTLARVLGKPKAHVQKNKIYYRYFSRSNII